MLLGEDLKWCSLWRKGWSCWGTVLESGELSDGVRLDCQYETLSYLEELRSILWEVEMLNCVTRARPSGYCEFVGAPVTGRVDSKY